MTGPFHPTAHLYDVIYGSLDYPGSARLVMEVVAERRTGASSMLDVACGTGRHLAELRGFFTECEGADIDTAMLEIAAARLPGVVLHEADMTTLDLGRRFDAVICMFSSIGYAHTPERLTAAISAMAGHLNPGGVLVVEPWLSPEMVREPLVRIEAHEAPGMVVARTARMRIEGRLSSLEFAYLVTTETGSETFREDHVMGLYSPDEYIAALEAAGLEAEFLEPGPLGRGLAVGVAPAA